MKKLILCEHKFLFGKILNPCRKVVASIKAKTIEQKEDLVIIEGLEEIILKCSRKGCGRKTTIKLKEE